MELHLLKITRDEETNDLKLYTNQATDDTLDTLFRGMRTKYKDSVAVICNADEVDMFILSDEDIEKTIETLLTAVSLLDKENPDVYVRALKKLNSDAGDKKIKQYH
jgi:hypothetical protein